MQNAICFSNIMPKKSHFTILLGAQHEKTREFIYSVGIMFEVNECFIQYQCSSRIKTIEFVCIVNQL